MFISKSIHSVTNGERFVVRSSANSSKYEILTLQIDNGEHFGISKDGTRFKYNNSNSGFDIDGSRHYLYYCEPIPFLMDDNDVINYVKTFSSIKNMPFIFHISSIEDNQINGNLVFHGTPKIDTELSMDCSTQTESWSWTSHGHLQKLDQVAVLDLRGVDVCVGDLIVLDGISVTLNDGNIKITSNNQSVTKLASDVLNDDLPLFFPMIHTEHPHNLLIQAQYNRILTLADPTDISDEILAAQLRLEPDEALVLWLQSENDDSTYCNFLSTKGYLFYVSDSPADEFYDRNVPEGLWLCNKAKAWSYRSYEGEWDGGIEADFIPATMEDLKRFGYSAESMSAEIKDYLEDADIDFSSQNLAEEFILKAHIAQQKTECDEMVTIPQMG